MTPSGDVTPLLGALASLQNLLERFDNRGIVIGGVAASLLGKPRVTADVDAVILLSLDELPSLVEAAIQEDLQPRIADAEEFARRSRVLLLRHRPSGINVDISLGMLAFEIEAVERSFVYELGPLSIRLPTVEDLVILKAVAHRPKDLQDIQGLINRHPDLDRERIRTWVVQFAEILEAPEIWEDIARWL